jgi:hypothetical protein
MILCEHLGKRHRSIINAFRKPTTTPANKVGNLGGFMVWLLKFS